jgi:hypothetical protein
MNLTEPVDPGLAPHRPASLTLIKDNQQIRGREMPFGRAATMPERSLSEWISEFKRFLRVRRCDSSALIVHELDQKPALAFWLRLRAFASLVRQITTC